MRRQAVLVTVAILLAVAGVPAVAHAGAPGTAASIDAGNSTPENGSITPEIVAIHPDPLAEEDVGEYVVVEGFDGANAGGWSVVDDAGAVAKVPNRSLPGRTILTPEPDAVETNHSATVLALDGQLRLANGGDSLSLRRPDGTVVSRVRYESAREGERYRRSSDGWTWQQPGATDIAPVETIPESATAFVLPDAPDVVEDSLRDADDRILLGGYTLTSERVVRALLDAHEQGVEVQVLLEGSPVGGVSERQAAALDRLSEAGIRVTVLAGERDPFGVHHAKYAVIDDRALVLTENFKPAGTGGHSSRGWGAVVEGSNTAEAFAEIFQADSSGPGAVRWSRHRSSVDPVPGGASSQSYPTHFTPESVPVERAHVLVAPDNARSEVEALLRTANDSIEIQQMEIDGIDDPLLQASIDAARNGTEVEILLSSASYVETENRALVREIQHIAERDNLSISASLVDPRGRFSKVHAKVAIVDGRHVVLGSLNWNEAAYEENRELTVVLTGEEVAAYYGAVFEADARASPYWQVPRTFVAIVAVVWLAFLGVVVARIRFAV